MIHKWRKRDPPTIFTDSDVKGTVNGSGDIMGSFWGQIGLCRVMVLQYDNSLQISPISSKFFIIPWG